MIAYVIKGLEFPSLKAGLKDSLLRHVGQSDEVSRVVLLHIKHSEDASLLSCHNTDVSKLSFDWKSVACFSIQDQIVVDFSSIDSMACNIGK